VEEGLSHRQIRRCCNLDIQEEEGVEGECLVPLAPWRYVTLRLIEPDGPEGAEGEGWDEEDDADDLLLLPWSGPVEEVSADQVHGEETADDAGYGSQDEHELVEVHACAWECLAVGWNVSVSRLRCITVFARVRRLYSCENDTHQGPMAMCTSFLQSRRTSRHLLPSLPWYWASRWPWLRPEGFCGVAGTKYCKFWLARRSCGRRMVVRIHNELEKRRGLTYTTIACRKSSRRQNWLPSML